MKRYTVLQTGPFEPPLLILTTEVSNESKIVARGKHGDLTELAEELNAAQYAKAAAQTPKGSNEE